MVQESKASRLRPRKVHARENNQWRLTPPFSVLSRWRHRSCVFESPTTIRQLDRYGYVLILTDIVLAATRCPNIGSCPGKYEIIIGATKVFRSIDSPSEGSTREMTTLSTSKHGLIFSDFPQEVLRIIDSQGVLVFDRKPVL
ncbi:hypothetical protein BDV37DRAFT_103699 [Aspergillus pseudonomiae]|uniref:Uncharacterized protein n=1 Tax=Aspergillus pseudonomiae TaxID=1506151 RepID=A0A5N7DGZ0_9EURO|nr:uncharacterized protein BDV37DRAFT_103699 [Aspergillus pseudonomiae]KAE8404928.1 hypothetical protein BDV37DRAFT_103699 [Aspergillus pseudonomiae]